MEKTQKVLIIDKNIDILTRKQGMLLLSDYEINFAEDGSTGLALYKEKRHDLIVLNVMQPVSNGLKTLNALRKISAVPVIIVSHESDEGEKISIDLGTEDCSEKPLIPLEFLSRIIFANRDLSISKSIEHDLRQYTA